MMQPPMWLSVLQAISYTVGSIAPLITIGIAYRALGSWRLTLQNQRIDECINATFDLLGALEQFCKIARMGVGNYRTYGETWDRDKEFHERLRSSFRNFDRSYTITRRYRPNLSAKVPFRIQTFLTEKSVPTEDEINIMEAAIREQLSHVLETLSAPTHKE
jgi:hypothetical protein